VELGDFTVFWFMDSLPFSSPEGVDPWLVFLRLLIACLYSYLPQTLQQWSVNLLGSVVLLLKITGLH